MNDYPEGASEFPEGTYAWTMHSEDEIVVIGDNLTINQIEYRGVATLKRNGDGRFCVNCGDIYFRRLSSSVEYTQSAYSRFYNRVLEVALDADTDELRQLTKLAVLKEELNGCSSTVIRLREEIEEKEDRIEEIGIELEKLGDYTCRPAGL